jgi:hypothetical protein
MIQKHIRSAKTALLAFSFCAATPLLQAGPVATRPTKRDVNDIVDQQELMRELLGEQNASLISRVNGRMQESQQRLANQTDPGAQTQEIQRRILSDIDDLIQALPKTPPPPSKNKNNTPNDGPKSPAKSPQSIGGNQAANSSDKPNPADAPDKKPSPDLQDRSEAFMQIAPRAVPAVIEGATEHISPKYRNLTEDYYKAVARASHDR